MVTQRYFSRSEAAFLLSVDRLFDCSKAVYFWTFTFKAVYHEWEYGKLWNRFMDGLQTAHSGRRRGRGAFMGLRVVEPHEQHGLHYHALLNTRLSVDMVRRVGKRFGIGRVYVVKADRGAGNYLGKYLGKKKTFATRIRKWGAVGGFLVCRKKDIEQSSPFHRTMSSVKRGGVLGCPGGKIPMDVSSAILGACAVHGNLGSWPAKVRVAVTRIARSSIERSGREKFFKSTRQYLPTDCGTLGTKIVSEFHRRKYGLA